MSSILKALKKLEDEKSARKPDSLDIDSEILRGDTSSRFSPLGVSIVAALIFVCGVGATYVYMKRGLSDQPKPQTAIAPPAAPSAALVTPAGKVRQAGGNNAPQEPLPQAQKTAARPLQKTVAPSAPSLAPAKQPVAKTQPKVQAVQPPKPASAAEPAKAAQQAASNAVRTTASGMTPVIKVNGIAFQDGSSDSMAVVNGVPVTNGSVVEGARVEDIQRDRVRFSYGGEKFEVPLGKANR